MKNLNFEKNENIKENIWHTLKLIFENMNKKSVKNVVAATFDSIFKDR